MRLSVEVFRISLSLLLALVLGVNPLFAQTATGTLRGSVADESGGRVVDAIVTVVDAAGVERTATTNEEGDYTIAGLTPGAYTVRAVAAGFAQYENASVEIAQGRTAPLDISLGIAIAAEEVAVAEQAPVSTEPENNASALVLRDSEITALPDDPDDLAAALQALAGPGAGPNGGQIYIDGFTGGRLPPRESIREIRVNQNPFSAEYDRLGFGRVEILTKPGTERWRGQAGFEFEDESFNSRNPFAFNRTAASGAAKRAPFQAREFGGNIGGSIIKSRLSFFADFERQDTDGNALINARILDPSLNVTPFQLAVVTPIERTTFSPRFDLQLNETNTLVGRYSYSRNGNINAGLNGFDLLSRAIDTSNNEHTFQLTETAVIGTTINEARFQYIDRRDRREGDVLPAINVLDAFNGGGSGIGTAFGNDRRFEFQNNTTFTFGSHSLKTGGRVRHLRLEDSSPTNFAGAFTFTSLFDYRDTINGVPGARPAQFSINGGDPLARVTQTDLGLYAQDDWRLRPDLTLSLGLRYEAQTNIDSSLNFAPRFSFAYAPGAASGSRARTVFRGGFGVFYERFGENLVLQTRRFNGINQQQFIINDSTPQGTALLDGVVFDEDGTASNIPTIDQLTAFALPQTVRTVADNLQAPYTIQSSFSVEHQLPRNTTLSVTYINARTLHLLRQRNLNAPLPGTITRDAQGRVTSAIYPTGAPGNIFQFESSGRYNQNQLSVNVRSRFSRRMNVDANYSLSKADSDTDGAFTFPADPYDFSGEYGRAGFDIRHRLFLRSQIETIWGLRFDPFILASSGRPYNITTGVDANGDAIFNERPTYAQLAAALAARGVVNSFTFDSSRANEIIPRNFGEGPSFFSVNLRASKTIGFGGKGNAAAAAGGQGGGGGRGGFGGGPFGGQGGGGGGRGGGFGGAAGDNRYNLTFSVQARNIFNNVNGGPPVGNLRSPFFGESIAISSRFGSGGDGAAGNRRIEAEVRFSF